MAKLEGLMAHDGASGVVRATFDDVRGVGGNEVSRQEWRAQLCSLSAELQPVGEKI